MVLKIVNINYLLIILLNKLTFYIDIVVLISKELFAKKFDINLEKNFN